jgi:hypothetical protein
VCVCVCEHAHDIVVGTLTRHLQLIRLCDSHLESI